MDLDEAIKKFDWPTRKHRALQIRDLDHSCNWVFEPKATSTTLEDNIGSDPEAKFGATELYADSDSTNSVDSVEVGLDPLRHAFVLSVEKRHDIEEWLQTEESLLCITGAPGTGKSTLIFYLATRARTRRALEAWQPNVLVLSHFFWKHGDALQRKSEGLLQNLICQIIYHDRMAGASSISFTDKEPSEEWTVSRLERAFVSLLGNRAVCIFVDDVPWKVLPYLRKLANIFKCKVCFTASLDVVQHDIKALRIEELTRYEMVQQASRELWQSLYKAKSSEEECMRIILRIVDEVKGVFLVLHLALYAALIQVSFKIDISKTIYVPLSLLDLRQHLLAKENVVDVANCFGIALNYQKLIQYSYKDIPSSDSRHQPSQDISVLEMVLSLRPEIQGILAQGSLTKGWELIMEETMEEVIIEIQTRCNGLLRIISLDNEFDVISHGQAVLQRPPGRWGLVKGMYQKIEVLPSAVSFLIGHGKTFLDLDPMPEQEHWLEIVRTFLVLAEAKLMTKAHVNRALLPLARIGSIELLKQCHKLYRRGKLTLYGGGGATTSKILPPFWALAATSSFRDFVISRVGPQATRVLLHLADYHLPTDKWTDVLDAYYEPLSELGDPIQRDIVAVDVEAQSKKRIVMYESATTRMFKKMIFHPPDLDRTWLQRITPSDSHLKQRTSIAVHVSAMKDQSGYSTALSDVHHWDIKDIFREEASGMKEVVYVLEIDLAFLLALFQRRLGIEHASTGYAELRSIQLYMSGDRKNFEVPQGDSKIVEALIRCLHQQDEEGLVLNSKTAKNIIEDGSRVFYKPASSLVQCLAQKEAGYTFIKEELFQMLRKDIE